MIEVVVSAMPAMHEHMQQRTGQQ